MLVQSDVSTQSMSGLASRRQCDTITDDAWLRIVLISMASARKSWKVDTKRELERAVLQVKAESGFSAESFDPSGHAVIVEVEAKIQVHQPNRTKFTRRVEKAI